VLRSQRIPSPNWLVVFAPPDGNDSHQAPACACTGFAAGFRSVLRKSWRPPHPEKQPPPIAPAHDMVNRTGYSTRNMRGMAKIYQNFQQITPNI